MALAKARVDFEVVGAYDINEHANQTYRENFGHSPCARNIEHLRPEDIDRLHADLWTMSPPCQPFTTLGLRRDHQDARTTPLFHLQKVLAALKHRPRYHHPPPGRGRVGPGPLARGAAGSH